MISQKVLAFTILLVVIALMQDKIANKFFSGNLHGNGPPPLNNAALMARYIAHNSEWASVGTISVSDSIKGSPFVGLQSIADGPETSGTGIPYMMMTEFDISVIDLNHDSRCTVFMSLAQGDYCKSKNYDQLDPRCARIMLTGNFEKLEKGSAEETFARNALYARHPSMTHWPLDHGFFIAKLNIAEVFIFNSFGGLKHLSPQEYFAANSNSYNLIDGLANELK